MKMWNYIFLSVFLALLFEMAGFPAFRNSLSVIGINISSGISGIQSSTFWIYLLAILGVGSAGAIIIGLFSRSQVENYVIVPIILLEAGIFIFPLYGIMSIAQSIGGWIFYIALLIIAPLAIGFVVSAYEHFRGTD